MIYNKKITNGAKADEIREILNSNFDSIAQYISSTFFLRIERTIGVNDWIYNSSTSCYQYEIVITDGVDDNVAVQTYLIQNGIYEEVVIDILADKINNSITLLSDMPFNGKVVIH